jgi:hypothetical protein
MVHPADGTTRAPRVLTDQEEIAMLKRDAAKARREAAEKARQEEEQRAQEETKKTRREATEATGRYNGKSALTRTNG